LSPQTRLLIPPPESARVKLVRCQSCRYSFERLPEDQRRECPQCGVELEPHEPVPQAEPTGALEDRKTRKIHIITKPED
jgi:hypothetical protein